MKTDKLQVVVKDLNQLFAETGHEQATGRLDAVQRLFPPAPLDCKKWIAQIEHDANLSTTGIAATEVRDLLASCARFLSSQKNKSDADISALADRLGQFDNADLGQLLWKAPQPAAKSKAKKPKEPPDLRKIDFFIRSLDTALGDDPGFKAIMAQLADKEVATNEEISLIAQRFAFAKVKGRASALGKIQARHDQLMAGRAKAEATHGRVAG